ncbi:general secretion pathway protein M (plasmid) [Legionella adelaidensis]|uniref:General secretion pathway protein M n=1 Tax=Legionella adelaidensis TaxID=45056 RepID=A0A0W0R362_9GAMM|nr:type II secretion system protein M [Legionella adelaidensis]KTC65491.1 putative general secretion pathway protein YghD [Legionella adelaidensis]VEH84688.1 general secretion pathway protein M [Legionella adelaidensis]
MNALLNYWQNLNDRERLITSVGIVAIVIYLFYVLIYAPLSTAIAEKTIQLKEKKETLIWMQQAQVERRKVKKQQTITNSQLLTLLAQQLKTKTFQSFPFKLEQTGIGDIQLSFELVPFIDIVNWLKQLSERYAISIRQLTIEKTDKPGLVKVLVFLGARDEK